MRFKRLLALMLAAVLLAGLVPALNRVARAEGLQYWIGVDVQNQRTTIYRVSDNHVVHRWLCTTGKSSTPTPQGVFYLPASKGSERQEWFNFTACCVKYAVRYTRSLYFHSVLFGSRNDNTMWVKTLRNLGHSGSAGCIRLEVQHAKWICDNCPTGTMVVIHNGVNDPRIVNLLGGPAGVETTPSLPAPPILVGLSLNASGPLTLTKGQTCQLTCTPEPANATTTLRWRSSRPKNVTVDQNGLVTAVGNGTSVISATGSNDIRVSVKVDSVDPAFARRVAINADRTVYVNVGETLQLGATVEPATAASALTWKSSRHQIAAVDGNGLVTGVRKGSAKITVVTSNRKKASVTVKVVNPYEPRSVRISQSGPVTLRVGETIQLTSVLTPDNARTALHWTSSRKKIAAVDGNGLVTAARKGTAKITVRTDNHKKATILIKVVD